MWNLIDNRKSSIFACIYYCVSLSLLLLYLLAMVLNTIPSILRFDENGEMMSNPWLDWVQIVCGCLCTMELVPRLIFSPSKKEFLMSLSTVVDILASLQFVVVSVLRLAGVVTYHVHTVASRSDWAACDNLYSVLSILGYVWILKLVRYSSSLQTFFSQVWSIRNHLFLLVQIMAVLALLFGSLVFWTEKNEEDTLFTDMPTSLYWALITLTTVGYGDISPYTGFGKLLACVCGVSGITSIILTITTMAITITRQSNP